ncbi:MAG: DUF5113 domain-containing protein [Bacteroidaceae bacterium]|nr:DUF5113 domain-containing protein [Bacteroidaceae bacterium]
MRSSFLCLLLCLLASLFSCGKSASPYDDMVDSLNMRAYHYRYINVDSTLKNAFKAYGEAYGYAEGRAEALCNQAFAAYQRMDFDFMDTLIASARANSRRHLIHLCADVLEMKAAQRTGEGEHFFRVKSMAENRIRRISGRLERMTARDKALWVYALTEFHIITSTYYFYQEQDSMARAELAQVPPCLKEHIDTAQWVYYNYMLGPGGLVEGRNAEDITLQEFDYLFRAYITSRRDSLRYFEANCLQAFATMFLSNDSLLRHERPDAYYLLRFQHGAENGGYLPLVFAERALQIFKEYEDLFQTACTYRTLGEICFHRGLYERSLKHYEKALHCVNRHHLRYYGDISPDTLSVFNPNDVERCVEREWIADPRISTVPEWIAGIRQQLSLTFSAMGMKQASDYNRNFYLDLVQATNQNLELESRTAELQRQTHALRSRMLLCLLLVVLALLMAGVFRYRLSRRSNTLLSQFRNNRWPEYDEYRQWNETQLAQLNDQREETQDNLTMSQQRMEDDKRKNAENRAKVSLVHNIVPFLDRIGGEVLRMKQSGHVTHERREYVVELSEQIERYNELLTRWITMERGQLSLHITSFPLSKLFGIIAEGHYSFDQKGVELKVEPTQAVVKADESLTLFMINTLCDNARKFTPSGGRVSVSAIEGDDYVEVQVSDTGCGLSPEDVETLSHSKLYDASSIGSTGEGKGFGFGLMNCRGIIEKYKKTSAIFAQCDFGVRSTLGQGSTFFFRLPRVVRMLLIFLLSASSLSASSITDNYDSLYLSNVDGCYEQSLTYAQRVIDALNQEHRNQPLMLLNDTLNTHSEAAEMLWAKDGVKADYDLIVGLRNEVALAALALGDWDLYRYNNRACIRLHRFTHQDKELPNYFHRIEQAHRSSNILLAVIVLASLFILYFAYRLLVVSQMAKKREILQLKDYLSHLFQEAKNGLQPQEFVQRTSSYPSLRQIAIRYQREVMDASVLPQSQCREAISDLQDEEARLQYEHNRLYVQNQILDNCLSTIKHESMYYPSRIRLLAEKMTDADIQQLSELVQYYHHIYTLLCQQADAQISQPVFRRQHIGLTEVLCMAQSAFTRLCRKQRIDVPLSVAEIPGELAASQVLTDAALLDLLLESLMRGMLHEGGNYQFAVEDDGIFVRLLLRDTTRQPSDEDLNELFFPDQGEISYLVAKQIVREHDTYYNHPGCRLVAQRSQPMGYEIYFTLLKHNKE